MRAVLCKTTGSLDDLVLEEIPIPRPGPKDVVIDVHAAGINFPDLLLVEGKYQDAPPLPFVPGGECAGRIVAVGDDVTFFDHGEQVIGTGLVGAFADRMVVPERSVLSIPLGMSHEVAASISVTYGTAYYGLKQQARLRDGETLLVLGAAGGVGTAAVQIGKAMGARVIAAASTDDKLEAARAAGADEGINYTDQDLRAQIKKLTDSKGADVIFDPVGGDFSEPAFRSIAWRGRYLVVGFAAGSIPSLALNLPLLKGAHITGVFWGAWAQKSRSASQMNFAELKGMFEDGQLKPEVTAYPLESFREALGELAERRVKGKVVLTMK